MRYQDSRRGSVQGAKLSESRSSSATLDNASRDFVRLILGMSVGLSLIFLTVFALAGRTDLAWATTGLAVMAVLAVVQVFRDRPRPMLLGVIGVPVVLIMVNMLSATTGVGVLIGVSALGSTLAMLRPRVGIAFGVYLASMIVVAVGISHGWTADVALVAVAVGPSVIGAGVIHRRIVKATVSNEHRLGSLISNAPQAIVAVDVTGSISLFNEAAEAMFGYQDSEMLGRPLWNLLPERFREVHLSHMMAFAEEPDSARSMDRRPQILGLRSNGEEFPVQICISKLSEDEKWEFIAILNDLTEREKARMELENLVKSKDDLIASISHEIRTPLTGIIGFARLLQGEVGLSEGDRHEMIETIVEQGSDLANVVEDLLAFAKDEAGLLETVRVPVDLRAQSAQVVEGLRRGDQGSISCQGGPTMAKGDPARVRQILRNLVSNALRYGRDPVTISIGGDETTGWVRVTDMGDGVTVDDEVRVFEAYERAGGQKSVTESLGLGLAISRDLARLMGGDVTYRRESDMTVFELTLPRDQ